ncbi:MULTISPECIES: Ger(x)C family spore germination protein [Paraliobacillus]|uniref:Ger(x)C family spore germination protein n=1 Tax=Paraliobacillus TaxID=200903 RepID=UPI00130092DD|nr:MULTISPECIES: Ger(x)C family spore germination protein [Paraliobacillus]
MKKIIMIICLLVLTGCWDRRELSDLGIVAGMAIDKDPITGEYVLTSQYIRPAAESTQSPTPEEPNLVVSTTGKSLAEVMRKSNKTIDRKSFFAHNKIIIISEELARDGLIPIIDSFQRGKEVRGHVWFSIAKDIEAKELLQIKKNGISRVPANSLHGLFENAEHDAVATNMLTYYKQVLEAGEDPVVGVLTREETEIKPFEQVELSGGAVFKEDKLVGFLNESDTRGYNWIREEGPMNDRGTMSLPSLLEEGKLATILLQQASSSITAKVGSDNQITFTIDVEQKARMTGQEATEAIKTRKEITDYLNDLQVVAEKEIETEIREVIDKAQEEFQSDIFGFGDILHKQYPKVWKKEKDNWSDTFVDVAYTVNVKVNITSSGLIQGPFKPKE